MESILEGQFSWWNLLLITLLFLLLFFSLQFLEKLLANTSFLGRWQGAGKKLVHYLLLVYEPLAVIILGSIFTLINPIFHGVILGLLLLAGLTHIRNYTNGWLVHANPGFVVGKGLKTGAWQGVVSRLGRLGFFLQTTEGLQYIGYSQLLSAGYTLTDGETFGGFFRLELTPQDPEKNKSDQLQHLMNLLVTAPYLDSDHRPVLQFSRADQDKLEIRLSIKEERHLNDLISLLGEWGYHSTVLTV